MSRLSRFTRRAKRTATSIYRQKLVTITTSSIIFISLHICFVLLTFFPFITNKIRHGCIWLKNILICTGNAEIAGSTLSQFGANNTEHTTLLLRFRALSSTQYISTTVLWGFSAYLTRRNLSLNTEKPISVVIPIFSFPTQFVCSHLIKESTVRGRGSGFFFISYHFHEIIFRNKFNS